jgi:hypothetical protein
VGFGTDLNGLKKNACFNSYFELRKVIEHWQKMGVAESRIQKFAIGNYARVLRQALTRTAPKQWAAAKRSTPVALDGVRGRFAVRPAVVGVNDESSAYLSGAEATENAWRFDGITTGSQNAV